MTHVLVTRPLEASQKLAGKLISLGLLPVVMPLYSFSAREPGQGLALALSVPHTRKLAVFTSPRAVQFGLSHLPASPMQEMEMAVVGAATRAALESSGYDVHLQSAAGYTSEDLLQLPGLAVDPGNAVIFCAPGGRVALAEGLAELGWQVTNAMVYEREPLKPTKVQIDALTKADELLSVWTSVSAINIAMEYLPAAVWEKILRAPALVISARILHHLQQLGATGVELADGPGNPALLKSIQRMTGLHTPV